MVADKYLFFNILSLLLNFKGRFGSPFPLTSKDEVTFSESQHVYFHMKFSVRPENTQMFF